MSHLVAYVHLFPHRNPRWDHRAGAEMYLLAMLQAWCERGHTATVIANRFKADDFEPCWLGKIRVLPRQRNAAEVLKADLLLTHLDYTEEAMDLSTRFGIPLAHLFHNDSSFLNYQTDRRADLYIFAAYWLAEECKPRDPSIPFVVCHPPVFRENFEHRSSLTDREFCTLVNLNENKGGTIFYLLAKALPDIKFLGVQGSYCDQIGMGAAELPNVTIVPSTPDMRAVYAQSRVVIMPSLYESYGMVCAEAMCNGVPVVCTRTKGLMEAGGTAPTFVDLPKRNTLDYWIEPVRKLMTDDAAWRHAAHKATVRSLQYDSAGELRHLMLHLDATIERTRRRAA